MLILFALFLACHEAEVTQPTTCSTTTVDDETWFDTSLAAERERFHASPEAEDADWNVSNEVGVTTERLTLDPVAFLADEAEACVSGDESALLQLSAPVSVEVSGQSWIPASTAEGVLQIGPTGQVLLRVELAVPFEEALRAAAADLIEAEMGVTVDETEVPDDARLEAGTAGPDSGFYAELLFTPDQTVGFDDASHPEPVGAQVRLAKTEH